VIRSEPQRHRVDVQGTRERHDGREHRARAAPRLQFADGVLRDAAAPFEVFLGELLLLPNRA
jgi:hypothetical protein